MENYIEPEIIERALKLIYGEEIRVKNKGKFSYCYRYDKEAKINKVRLAQEVVNLKPTLDRFDLSTKILQLVAFVKKANSIE